MNMKRFHEKNMHAALQRIREELGEDAVIISSNQNLNGVEVVAATDYEAVANSDLATNKEVHGNNPATMRFSNSEINQNKIAESNPMHNAADLQNEISQLRSMIESQTELISWRKLIAQNSASRKLLQKLSICGFGFNLSKKLLGSVKKLTDFDQAWSVIENDLQRKITITQENIIDDGGMVALVGPTGVGKTTTIAKIAAQYAIQHGNSDIAIISTDHFRIGAHDQISIYGSILNVPVVIANNESELRKALNIVRRKNLF